jgi:tripartite-type tricarboxylate transporter receptor subunit TctC
MHFRIADKMILATMLAVSSCCAFGQSYPVRPIRLLVPFAPGGTTDFLARVMGKTLGERLGQNFIVDNRAGAGGTIGADMLAKADGDGYTLLIWHVALTTAPSLYKKLPYDTLRDIAPITLLGTTPSILVVNPALKVNTVQDLVAAAKASPGRLNYGSAGFGSAAHLATALFENLANVRFSHIPYKGGSLALAAAVAGEVQFMLETMPDTYRQVKAGRLRLLAVSTAKRLPALPDVPTIAESGVPGYEYYTWFGLFAPGTTPKPLLARINTIVNEALALPAVQDDLKKDGVDPRGSTIEELNALVRTDLAKWAKVIKQTGMRNE